MIKLIVFDVTGVITEPVHYMDMFINRLVFKYSADKEIISDTIIAASGKYNAEEINLESFIDSILKGLDVAATKEDIIREIYECSRIKEEIISLIISLRNNDYLIGYCTNRSKITLEVIESFKKAHLFDIGVTRQSAGAGKPNSQIYEYLLDQTEKKGITADEILYTDDKEENLIAANIFGIKTIHFNTFEKFQIKLKEMEIKF